MSQTPPQGQGWVDANGYQQPGFPPPGFWQASDGRWYPPESADPSFAPQQPPQQTPQPGAPEFGYQPLGLAGTPTEAMPPPGQPGAPSQPGQPVAPGPPQHQPGQPQYPTGPPQHPTGPPQYTAPQPGQPAPGGFPPPGPPQHQPGYPGTPTPGAPGAPPTGPPPAYGSPGPAGPAKPLDSSSKTGLWIVLGILGIGTLAIVGLSAAILAARSGDPDSDRPSTTESATGGSGSETDNDDPEPTTTPTTTPTTAATVPEPAPGGTDTDTGFLGVDDGLDDVLSCTLIDDETLEVELTNQTSESVDYYLTVAFFDSDGARLSDTSAFVTALRPGEYAREEVYIFDEPGASCEVIAAERFNSDIDEVALAEISSCTVIGPDFADDVLAELAVTNSGSVTYNYSIDVALISPEGVRRGTGFGYVEAVRPGETAPTEIYSTVGYRDGFTCDVVAVFRTEP